MAPPPRPENDAPLWLTTYSAGLRHVGASMEAGLSDYEGFSAALKALRKARAEWCRENGCFRRPQTCEQVHGPDYRQCDVPTPRGRDV